MYEGYIQGEAGTTCGNQHLRLSVVLPAHPSGAPLVRRTLLGLRHQTVLPGQFEVILVADGGDPGNRLHDVFEPFKQRFLCRYIESPRPGGDLPHKNHARNAGCAAAAGELVWVLDADFLLPPHAIAHVLDQYDRLSAQGKTGYLLHQCRDGRMEEPARCGPGAQSLCTSAAAGTGHPTSYPVRKTS
ncbi:MAG: glycosyltransferase family 2 protein [Candidatus Aminicenantes bacterium]|nr:MAG: glycosyltransferase family 2 protein [Candidatus Aminicenantes bacterium]